MRCKTADLIVLALVLWGATPSAEAVADAPRVNLNQHYIESVNAAGTVDIEDPVDVFKTVLHALPPRVTVYPTENYFYFNFHESGVKYAGNVRLDASDRDRGIVHFAYFRDYTEWGRGGDMVYRALDATSGVRLERIGPLLYRLTFESKSVEFALNDLSTVTPPEGFLRPGESYLGPVYDESGVQFYFVFNAGLRKFYYFLNEHVTASETYRTSSYSRRILIGERTGFAYFRDRFRDRKILIGVYESNSNTNNYFDGPFDQLPDNFLKGDELRQAILAVKPDLAGKIDRFGNSPDGSERYYIGPYTPYRGDEDLEIFDQCASAAGKADVYYRCFDATGIPPGLHAQQ
jgi:hypothetical protein